MRLDKYLADMSIDTRSEVKKLISKGHIKVNEVIVKQADYKVLDSDIVFFDDKEITYVEYEYYILNKPQGYLTATEDNNDPVVMDLIKSKRKDLVPVGRLDKDTEGLLLITNDGKLNHYLLSPNNHILKKYYVELDKQIPENAKDIFSKSMDLGDFITKPAIYQNISPTSCYLTISEGKYHQVKRMFEKIGTTVTYLKRVEFKNLKLDDLKLGEFRPLSKQELEELKK